MIKLDKNLNGYQLEKKIAIATKWSFITELIAKIIVPISNAILAHLLSPEAFGVVVTINMVISFTDVLTESGFGQFLIQHDFKDDIQYNNYIDVAFWCNFTVSVLLWLIIFFIRDSLASFVGSRGYGVPLIIACLSIPITSFSNIPIAILQKKLDYKSLFFNRISGSLTHLIISTFLALLDMGYWALILGTLFSHIVKAIVLITRSGWHPHMYFSLYDLKKMFNYNIWILLEAIAMWACLWGDIFIVSHTLGSYYTGIYKTAQTTVTGILSIVTASVNSIVFVTLSKYKNDMKKFRNCFYEYQKNLAIIVVPMGVGILVFRELITAVLLGTKWIEAAEFLGLWGLCMAMVATMGTFCREALRAKGFTKTSLLVQVLHFLFIIPMVIIGTSICFKVLIYMRSLAYLQSILLLHIFAKKKLGLSPLLIYKNTVWPAVCAIIMGMIGFILNQKGDNTLWLPFIKMFVCAIVYFLILVLSKEYRKQIIIMMKEHLRII